MTFNPIIAVVSATFTRPADTTAYASADVVANSTTAGSVTPLTFVVGNPTNAGGKIRRVRLSKSSTTTTNASFRLHLYSASPTLTNGDNGALSTNKAANYLGALDITVGTAFSDGAQGIGVPNTGSEINFGGHATVYGILEARAAYGPASAEVFVADLEVERY